ncbi:multiubiquitin domain-containing protein [Bremerella sp.]|uniref:multiubiquitin domain-containing protein n=1 Tax=Bremerella sp. TaxID=2795602 RepID=UPI003918E580
MIPLPRRKLKVRDILYQAGADPESATLIRDFNSPIDIGFKPDAQVDLSDGNVFRIIVAGACEQRHVVASESPKLAFVVDDRWEVTIQPNQTDESLRGLFGIPDGIELLRDFESPIDEPIEKGERVNFKDGPVFITRKAEVREITIIVRGRPRKVSGRHISFDEVVALAYNPVRSEPFIVYTVSYSRGPNPNPEGDLYRNQTVKIKEGMVFCVTETDKS